MAHTPFTPEQEKRIKELQAEGQKRAGLLGWLQRVLPNDPLPFALCFLIFYFSSIDDIYNRCKDAVEYTPVVLDYAGHAAYNAFNRLEQGYGLPAAPDGGGYYATVASRGITPPSGIPAGTSTGNYYSYTAPVEIWVTDADGTIRVFDAKKPLT